jgi:hypothetical protein
MGPVGRAVAGVLRLVGAACLVFGLLLGVMVAYHLYGRKAGFPLGAALGAVGLLAAGVVILLKSSVLAARLTDDDED